MNDLNTSLTFVYDGECPFCNHFAELLELKSQITDIKIVDGRKNKDLTKHLLEKGLDIDKGAILIKNSEFYHGAEAINTVCNLIKNPSNKLLKILSYTFKSSSRTKFIFPLLVIARRFTLISKGVSTSLT